MVTFDSVPIQLKILAFMVQNFKKALTDVHVRK